MTHNSPLDKSYKEKDLVAILVPWITIPFKKFEIILVATVF